MRKKNLYIILLLFILMLSLSAYSQTNAINTDIQRINIALFEAKRIYIEMDYTLFFDQIPKSSMKGIVKKNDRMLHQQIGDITVVKNNEYSVFIHRSKKILVVDPNPASKDPIKKEDLFRINVDTLKNWILSSELAESNGIRTITFTLKKGEYSRIIIEYDPLTYFLKRMNLHARETYLSAADQKRYNVRMEVLFNNISTEHQFGSSDFSIDDYVVIKNKETVNAVGVYKQYNLINNLNKSIKYVK